MTQQLCVTAAEIRQCGGLEKFVRRMEAQSSALGAGRILGVRESCAGDTRREHPQNRPEIPLGASKTRKVISRHRKTQNSVKTPLCPKEDEEQAQVISWAKANERRCPALALLFHVPNGGLRFKATAARLTAQGVKKGVPDLCLPVPSGPYHGLYVEMKRAKGGALQPEQQEWLRQLALHGYRAVLCKGADAAIAEITNYLGILR